MLLKRHYIKQDVLSNYVMIAKGQIISKDFLMSSFWLKKPTKFCLRISALASKKRSDQKIKALYITNQGLFNITTYIIKFIWFEFFLEARAEILNFFFGGFLVQTMTPKKPFELNWPLLHPRNWGPYSIIQFLPRFIGKSYFPIKRLLARVTQQEFQCCLCLVQWLTEAKK